MMAGFLKFNTLPEIGFAHNYLVDNYAYNYGKSNHTFEIAHINSGRVLLEYNNKTLVADEGSILVLFRELPIKIHSSGKTPQFHCTLQLDFDFEFVLTDNNSIYSDNGLLLPFVVPSQIGTAEIKKELNDIVHLISETPGRYNFNARIRALGILEKIDRIARKPSQSISNAHSKIAVAVRTYVDDNIERKITLKDLSDALKKSPNYVNSAIRSVYGKSIIEYINEKKIRYICVLMQKNNISFSHACDIMGFCDVSYGYRLFKKHMGITPSAYMKSEIIIK